MADVTTDDLPPTGTPRAVPPRRSGAAASPPPRTPAAPRPPRAARAAARPGPLQHESVADIRETVREKYAAAARQAADAGSWCCEAGFDRADTGEQTCGATLYGEEGAGAAVNASLGCGVPTAVADLHEGETVLDLGSGAGADVLISAPARRPDRQGHGVGHDRRDARPRARQRRAGGPGERRVRQGATSRTFRCPTTPSTSSSPTASSTSPPTSTR